MHSRDAHVGRRDVGRFRVDANLVNLRRIWGRPLAGDNARARCDRMEDGKGGQHAQRRSCFEANLDRFPEIRAKCCRLPYSIALGLMPI